MAATETLWRDHHDRLAAFIRSRVVDRATADDILQEVFLKVHTASPSVTDGTKLRSWLYRVARNAVVDHYRSSKPQEPLPESLAQPTSARGEAARRELTACLRPMMDRLPLPYKEAVTLADLEDRPQQEIAQTQGLSLSGAKSRIQRGRVMVKELLAQCCQLEFDHRGILVDYEPGNHPCGPC